MSKTEHRVNRVETEDHLLCRCDAPDYREARVPFWPFRAAYCRNCGDVNLTVGWLLTQIWRYAVWPIWHGRVVIIMGRRWRP